MRNIRNLAAVAALLILLSSLSCADKQPAPLADRCFSTHWLSWHGYSAEEPVSVQMALILSSPTEGDHVMTAALSRSGETSLPAAHCRLSAGSEGKGYGLFTLSLTLGPLPPGRYEFDRLELTFGDGSAGRWDIGRWAFDVGPDADEGARYVTLGKRSTASGELDWNRFELTNASDRDITVLGLEFDLPGVRVCGAPLVSDSFLPGGKHAGHDDLVLSPGQTRTFQFDLCTDPSVDTSFFSIKPRLRLDVRGTEIQAALSPVVYAPFNLTDEEVAALMQLGGRLSQ